MQAPLQVCGASCCVAGSPSEEQKNFHYMTCWDVIVLDDILPELPIIMCSGT